MAAYNSFGVHCAASSKVSIRSDCGTTNLCPYISSPSPTVSSSLASSRVARNGGSRSFLCGHPSDNIRGSVGKQDLQIVPVYMIQVVGCLQEGVILCPSYTFLLGLVSVKTSFGTGARETVSAVYRFLPGT